MLHVICCSVLHSQPQERRALAESAQCELGPDSLGPDTNVATLVQRILKCGVLTRKTVEYRSGVSRGGYVDHGRYMTSSNNT